MIEKLTYFFKVFLPEVRGEWKKVTRPNRREVVQTTGVVVVTSFIFAVYLWAADLAIRWAYEGMFKILGL
jgi:preprotein translocase SecE subunit